MERWAPAEHKRSRKEKAWKDVAKMAAMDGDGDEGEDEVAAVEEEDDTARKEQRVLKYFWLPPIEGSAVLAMALAFTWWKAVRLWPEVMVHFMLWSTFSFTMAAGIVLLCFSLTPTISLGIALIGFSIGTGLYACWFNRRTDFTARVFHLSHLPMAKFPGLNGPAYLMLAVGFLWMSLWCFAIFGMLNFFYSPLTTIALVLSLA